MGKLHAVLLAAALALAAAVPASGLAGERGDHDRARQALEAGEVLPLKTILERVEREYPGQVLEVELDREEGRWIYELKLLRTGGDLVKLRIDAGSSAVLEMKVRKNESRRGGQR